MCELEPCLLQGQPRIGLVYLTGAPQNNHAFRVNLGSRTQDCSLHENDFLDAEAIAETVDRENMRFVPIKTDDRLDLQALHRVRDRLFRPGLPAPKEDSRHRPVGCNRDHGRYRQRRCLQTPHNLASRQNRILPPAQTVRNHKTPPASNLNANLPFRRRVHSSPVLRAHTFRNSSRSHPLPWGWRQRRPLASISGPSNQPPGHRLIRRPLL
jgi:hypothetical protein